MRYASGYYHKQTHYAQSAFTSKLSLD